MRLDYLLKFMLRSYFMIVTGIVVSIFVTCQIFYPDATFTLNEIGQILILALFGDLPSVLFYSRKEPGKKQMLIRQILHLFVLYAVLFYFVHRWHWVDLGSFKNIVIYSAEVLLIYLLVRIAHIYQDKKTADKLNDRLKQRYHS